MPAEYHMLRIQNIHSEISFPLIYRDTFCGFIGLDNPTMERTEPIVHILEVIGRTLCAARENIRKDRLLEKNQNSILAITANAFAQDIARCKAAGMNDHLPKSINIHKLLAMLALYVQPPHS